MADGGEQLHHTFGCWGWDVGGVADDRDAVSHEARGVGHHADDPLRARHAGERGGREAGDDRDEHRVAAEVAGDLAAGVGRLLRLHGEKHEAGRGGGSRGRVGKVDAGQPRRQPLAGRSVRIIHGDVGRRE